MERRRNSSQSFLTKVGAEIRNEGIDNVMAGYECEEFLLCTWVLGCETSRLVEREGFLGRVGKVGRKRGLVGL